MTIRSIAAPLDPDRTFSNIGTALREVATIVARLEEAALHMRSGAVDAPQRTKALQDFDLVLQSLADLACLMEAIATVEPTLKNCDPAQIIATMRLAWLRDLISGRAHTGHDHNEIAIF
jgi:hypothetical protein